MFSLSYDAQRGEVTRPRPHSRTCVLADSKARVHRLVNRLFRKGQNSGEIGCVCVVFLEWCQEVGMALKILKGQDRAQSQRQMSAVSWDNLGALQTPIPLDIPEPPPR